MGDNGGPRQVKSDETMFALVEHLEETGGAGVTELAERTGLAKSTVHKHLATMREHGYVARRGDRYALGLQFFHVGNAVRNQFDIYHAARPEVDDLVAETGEMASVLAHQDGRVMYLYGNGGRTGINVDAIRGSWAHMHCNSGGKAILGHLPESAVDDVVERHGLPAMTENTITDREALFEELERVREQGYAINRGEDLTGIHAVSVPLVFEGTVRGALAVAGPAHRVTEERCEGELADALFAARNDIELSLTYS